MKEPNTIKDWHYTKKYPILWKGKWIWERDCGSVFAAIYSCREALYLPETKCYVSEGMWVYPDDTFEHDPKR